MDQTKSEYKNENRIIAACIVAMIICLLALIYSERLFMRNQNLLSNREEIGKVTTHVNDARIRSENSFTWQKIQPQDKVMLGDSVFSGKGSSAHIELKSGGSIDVGEDSLVVFNKKKHQNLAQLLSGNFRVKVDGSVKVAVGNQVTTLQGKDSEVQVVMTKGEAPRVRVLKGEVEKKSKSGEIVKLDKIKITKIENEEPLQNVLNEANEDVEVGDAPIPVVMSTPIPAPVPTAAPSAAPTAAPVAVATPAPTATAASSQAQSPIANLQSSSAAASFAAASSKAASSFAASSAVVVVPTPTPEPPSEIADDLTSKTVVYNWRLYDLYEESPTGLNEVDEMPEVVTASNVLTWSSSGKNKGFVQLSSRPNFVGAHSFPTWESNKLRLKSAFRGANYWHVSLDQGKTWSDTDKFTVHTQFQKSETPEIANEHKQVPLAGEKAEIEIELKPNSENLGHIVEVSDDSSFPRETSKIT